MEFDREKMAKALAECHGGACFSGCYLFDTAIKDEQMRCMNCLNIANEVIKQLTEENVELRREYDSMAKSVNEASELIRSLKSRIKRLEAYDEQRDIALHARLIGETRVDTARGIFEPIINALKYTTFASPLEKNGTLDYIYSLRDKYIKDVK